MPVTGAAGVTLLSGARHPADVRQGQKLGAVPGVTVLLTWLQTSGGQSSDTGRVCCAKPPRCGAWLWPPSESHRRPLSLPLRVDSKGWGNRGVRGQGPGAGHTVGWWQRDRKGRRATAVPRT